MSAHDYTPHEALDTLMRSLRARNSELAAQIQAVVDAGKDVQETEPSRGRRKRSRSYRKTQPYSYEEALQAALGALRSYFVEQPHFINSCLDNMVGATVERPRRDRHAWLNPKERTMIGDPESRGQEKEVDIELRTETQISEPSQEVFRFKRVEETLLEEQQQNIIRLSSLFDFKE